MSTEDNASEAKSRNRSIAYPFISLGDAVHAADRLLTAVGNYPSSRLDAAKALGHSALTGSSARKVAALVQYGLLERSGNTYKLTVLAQNILRPEDETGKSKALQQAARRPRIFEKLIQRYNGQALPTMLSNIVLREGVASDAAAKDVVRIFKETLTYADLLVNGVVVAGGESVTGEDEDSDADLERDETFNSKSGATRMARPISPMVNDSFTFDFSGGIQLIIPRTQAISDAIADGELREIRKEIANFAAKFESDVDAESLDNA